MNDMRTIDELNDDLRAMDGTTPEMLGAPRLDAIRVQGRRRRRARRALVGGSGFVAAAAVLGVLVSVSPLVGGEQSADDQVASDTTPEGLSDLAERALREIPGAVQVSSWQVVLPSPDEPTFLPQPHLGADRLAGDPVVLPADNYTGVTAFSRTAFPDWLYSGVGQIEEDEGDENGQAVGSTDLGILVDTGGLFLGCTVWPEISGCMPSLLSRDGDGYAYEWGMGTDDFLDPGSDMEVFLSDDYSTGSPGQLALAGLPGTDVARVEFVTTTGEVVPGTVESGTVVPGDTMMWARVPGRLASVIAYDAAGNVIEDHPLKSCDEDNPVSCEVR